MKDSVVVTIVDTSYGINDRKMIENLFPDGTHVDVLGTDVPGIIVGNLRMVYPLKEQTCQRESDMHCNPPPAKVSSFGCTYPNCECEVKNEVIERKGAWRIDVLIGKEEKHLDPWMLRAKDT